jgi:thiol:disulfide interchange protein DsbC
MDLPTYFISGIHVMIKKKLPTLIFSASVLAGMSLYAMSGSFSDRVVEDSVNSILNGAKVTSVENSEVEGIKEVIIENKDTVHVSKDGRFIFMGDLMRISDDGVLENVSEEKRSAERKKTIEDYQRKGVISYPADNEKARVSVFTDIDCPYCRKFHDSLSELNALGISVDYYAFPRGGPETSSWPKHEAVWCSDDPAASLSLAKNSMDISPISCDNPVAEHYALGVLVGVTGTPSIVLDGGEMIGGLIPPEELAKALKIK